MFGAQGVSAALPAVQHALGISDSGLGLFTAAYMLPAAVFAIPLGYLADVFGRRRVFVSMSLVYGVSGAAQAWVSSFGLMLGLRFVEGIAFGALMPLSVTMIGDVRRGAEQLRAQSRRQVWMAVGEFALPFAGAALAAASFRVALGAQGAIALLGLAGVWVLDDRRHAGRGGSYRSELTAAVRQPGMPAALLAGFMRMACKFALVAYLPLLLVATRGATLGQAALVLSVGSGVAAVMNMLVVRVAGRAPASRLLMLSFALVGLALAGFAVLPGWELALGAAVLYGIGDGVLMVLQNALVTEAAPDGVRGGLVAVSGMTRNAGKLAAPLAMGALILVVSVPVSFAVVGAAMWATVPALRSVRRLDGLLRVDAAAPAAVVGDDPVSPPAAKPV